MQISLSLVGIRYKDFSSVYRNCEKFSDIDLVVFVVENADEVRLIYFS